jgi:hypothetical protein
MKTEFAIQGVRNLRDGTVVLTGSVAGPLLRIGQRGVGVVPSGHIKVEIIGGGALDPDLTRPNMQMVQIKVLEGDIRSLNRATLSFD